MPCLDQCDNTGPVSLNSGRLAVANMRKKNPKQPSRARPSSPADLLRAGGKALAARRFREAMDHFKAVAKTDTERSVWEAGLAEAYRGRALVLAKMPRQPPPATMRAFSNTDWNLVTAQRVEEEFDLWTVVDCWRTVFERMRLDSPEAAQPGSDAALRIALLQRRMATDLKLLTRQPALRSSRSSNKACRSTPSTCRVTCC
jgi:hypothetical protein